jgi:shikimate dehydrogenase
MPLLSRGMAIDGTRCLVIGAGGAGRAAVLALSRLGGKVVIANRTESRARDAARLAEGGTEVAGLGRLDELSASCPVIVSAVPSSALPALSTWFRAGRDAIVIDADYRAGILAAFARERGCEAVDGLEWLASQSLRSFEFLAGRPAPVEAKTLVTSLGTGGSRRANGSSVALIGLSGSGKTAIGERLALRMGARFIDVDERVERRKGMTVPEIFSREGESAFRALEKEETLRACAFEPPSVIATGGGAPEDPEIARALHSRSTVAWLHASAKTLASRISPGSRPLLGDADPLAALERLFARRRDAYATVADLCVATDRGDPDGVAELLHAEVS